MPTSTTGSKVRKTPASSKTSTRAKKNPAQEVEETTVNAAVVEEPVPAEEEKPTYKVKKDLSPTMMVTVKNGFNGTLVYKSKRTR